MKNIQKMMLLSLVVALGSCSNEENLMPEAAKQITVEAGFGVKSRVTTDGLTSAFESGDAIGVYAWTGGVTLPASADDMVVNNVANTFDGSSWSATPQMLWKDDATPHYFLGVYPQTDIFTTTTYTLDPTDQEKSDLLVATNFGANNEGITAQADPVSLAFGHVMAKLRVNVRFNDEFTTASVVSGVTAEALTTADIDWQTATATATGTASGVQLLPLPVVESGFAYSYESVMVPQTGLRNVAMVIDGETYTFVSSEDIELKKGTVTTLNLTAGRTSITTGGITILDWTLEGEIDGNLQNIDKEIDELAGYIEALQTAAADLQSQLDATNVLIESLETDNATQQTEIDELKDAKTALETDIATINETITTLTSRLTIIEGKIASLEEAVAACATQEDVDEVKQNLATVQSDMAAMKEAVTALQGRMDTVEGEVDSLQTAVDSLEDRIEALEKNFANRIQSLTFVPQYSDGKILMDYTGRTTQAHFRISPAAIAKLIAVENVEAFARYTNDPTTRAYEPEFPLVVVSVTGDETGMLEVNLKEDSENLFDTDFWAGKKEAVIYIRISDGNSDVVSDAIPMMAHGYGSNEGNRVYGFGDGNTYTGEITE